MTDLLILAGSLLAIAATAGLVAWLKMGQSVLRSEADAIRVTAEAISGFEPVSAMVSRDGLSALVFDEIQQVVIVKNHGAQFVARQIAPPFTATQTGDVWQIDSGERFFGQISFTPHKKDRDRLLTLM